MSKLIILKGLPASGKSTWAKDFLFDEQNYRRVNKDDLRMMLNGGVYDHDVERDIIEIRDFLVGHWLFNGYNVIVDDTNFNPIHENALRKIANKYACEVEVKFFDAPVSELISRNERRSPRDKVPEHAIIGMARKYKDEINTLRELKSLES